MNESREKKTKDARLGTHYSDFEKRKTQQRKLTRSGQ